KVTRSPWAASRIRAASAISSGRGTRSTSKGSERGTETMAAQASAAHPILNNATLDSVRECHCQLCGPMPATDPLAAHVARPGWSVVSAPAEGPRPAYAFTVGLWHSFAHAEASLFGRDEDEMVRWLDVVAR